MLTSVPESLRIGWRTVAVVALSLIAVIAFAACNPDPTSTPVPTPVPTPTPLPTATPTPIPATATPTPEPAPAGSIDDLVFNETTTARDVIAFFSEDEVACLRRTVGDDAFNMLIDTPVMGGSESTPPFPVDCLTPESITGFWVAMLSSQAGGLSAESRSCIKDVVAANPSVLGFQEPTTESDFAALLASGIEMQLCLTDEEAMALAGGQGGGEFPPPSVMRCMEERLGSQEEFLEMFLSMFSGEVTDPEALLAVFAAAEECGLDMGLPPEGG